MGVLAGLLLIFAALHHSSSAPSVRSIDDNASSSSLSLRELLQAYQVLYERQFHEPLPEAQKALLAILPRYEGQTQTKFRGIRRENRKAPEYVSDRNRKREGRRAFQHDSDFNKVEKELTTTESQTKDNVTIEPEKKSTVTATTAAESSTSESQATTLMQEASTTMISEIISPTTTASSTTIKTTSQILQSEATSTVTVKTTSQSPHKEVKFNSTLSPFTLKPTTTGEVSKQTVNTVNEHAKPVFDINTGKPIIETTTLSSSTTKTLMEAAASKMEATRPFVAGVHATNKQLAPPIVTTTRHSPVATTAEPAAAKENIESKSNLSKSKEKDSANQTFTDEVMGNALINAIETSTKEVVSSTPVQATSVAPSSPPPRLENGLQRKIERKQGKTIPSAPKPNFRKSVALDMKESNVVEPPTKLMSTEAPAKTKTLEAPAKPPPLKPSKLILAPTQKPPKSLPPRVNTDSQKSFLPTPKEKVAKPHPIFSKPINIAKPRQRLQVMNHVVMPRLPARVSPQLRRGQPLSRRRPMRRPQPAARAALPPVRPQPSTVRPQLREVASSPMLIVIKNGRVMDLTPQQQKDLALVLNAMGAMGASSAETSNIRRAPARRLMPDPARRRAA